MNVRVATIQMNSDSDYSANKKQAEALIAEAVDDGAELIILPEMAICGYSFSDRIWNEAEPIKGRTYRWLKDICDSHKVYIGLCILECDGTDYYDTFILVGPNNQLWSHRKVEPAGYEGFFFKGAGINECVFTTPLGKIGVIICFDTTKMYIVSDLAKNNPDIIIIPYAAMGMPKSFPEKPRENWESVYRAIPGIFSKMLGRPVITSNKTGLFASPMPMGFGMKYEADYFDESCIMDTNGRLLSSVKGKAGFAAATIRYESIDNDTHVEINRKWFLEISRFTKYMSEITKNIGGLRYTLSKGRKKSAMSVCNPTCDPAVEVGLGDKHRSNQSPSV